MTDQLQTLQQFGLEVTCPATWDVSFDKRAQEATISISNDETSFWMATLYYECPLLEELLAAAEQAFTDEYDDVDVYDATDTICNQTTQARDLEFFCEQLTNTARLRACSTPNATLFVLYQGTDSELVETLPTLERITASLRLLHDDENVIV